jgi:hypothetical protein
MKVMANIVTRLVAQSSRIYNDWIHSQLQFQTQLMELKSKNGVDFGPSNCHNELLQQKLPMKHCDKTMTHIKVNNFSNLTSCRK